MATSQTLTPAEKLAASASKPADQTLPSAEIKTTGPTPAEDNAELKRERELQASLDCFSRWRIAACGQNPVGNYCCEIWCCLCMCISGAESEIKKDVTSFFAARRAAAARPPADQSMEMQTVNSLKAVR